MPLSRRGIMLAAAGLGGLSAAATPSEAQSAGKPVGGREEQGGTRPWRGDVDAGGYALLNLGGLERADNNARITDFEGANLAIDTRDTVNIVDGPGSGLDADTLDGLQRHALERRISELELNVEANRSFVETAAQDLNDALAAVAGYVNSDLQTVEER